MRRGETYTVEELSDILVADEGLTVDVSGGLRNQIDVVSRDDDLILLSLGFSNGNTFKHLDVTDTLLSQEVTSRRVGRNQ